MLEFNKIPCSKVANKQYTCNKATLIKYRKNTTIIRCSFN